MVAQRAGQKRKVVEVPRPAEEEEGEVFGNGELNGTIDEDEDEDDFSDGQSEDEDSKEVGWSDEEEGYLDSDEVPTSEDEDAVRQQLPDLEKGKTPGKELMGSETAKYVAAISSDTPVQLLQDDSDADRPNYTITEDAHGNARYIYRPIEPEYDSDDSALETTNTIGNIPLSYYDAYPHIGYDINGKKISRPAAGEALDSLLDSIDVPEGWTGLTDPATGKPLQLSGEDLEVLKKLTRNEVLGDGYDPYPDMVEYFTGKGLEETMPLSAAPEPKRRFVPSMHEHKRVMKMVKAIREGRIKPYRAPTDEDKEREEAQFDYATYDVWANEAPKPDHPMNVPAPKIPPPGYEESYHPPPEYLPDDDEKKAWLAQDEEDRTKDFLPRDHAALRRVPGYERSIKDRFERSMDLYLAPRVRRSKMNIDPESLLPKLPDPAELRPFPDHVAVLYRGHEGRVRHVSIDPTGTLVASGGDDGTVRIWDLKTGHCSWRAKLSNSDAVHIVSWRPGSTSCILAACCGENIHFMLPPLPNLTPDVERAAIEVLTAGFAHAASAPAKTASGSDKPNTATWHRPISSLASSGVLLSISLRSAPKTLSWHRRGDYFATVCPSSSSTSTAVGIHTLSKHLTQHPFRRLKGLAQTALFHPSKPLFFAATRQRIRVYDLQQQKLEKELQPGVRWISSMSLHPLGSNLLVSSFDKRLLWHDLDTGNTPYKTLRYHGKAIRDVKFHPSLPLFADASDDGTVQVFYGRVMTDEMESATIVPLKVLKGHRVVQQLGVVALDWHPREAWCVSAGADGTIRLWT